VCGSDEPGLAPQDAADAALLRLEDLPRGWYKAPPDEDDPLPPGYEQRFDECAGLPVDAAGDFELQGELAGADSLEYESGRATVETSVSVLENEWSSELALQAYGSAFANCRQVFLDLFNLALKDELAADGTDVSSLKLSAGFDEFDPGDIGNSRRAFRLTVHITNEQAGVEMELSIDLIIVRVGQLDGLLTYVATSDDAVTRTGLIRTFVRKMEEADDKLDVNAKPLPHTETALPQVTNR
jgi:hypothetical protein